jgi:hypothetical protein
MYGGFIHDWSSFVPCGSFSGPPTVRGANAGLPTTEPVKTRLTQWSSVKM